MKKVAVVRAFLEGKAKKSGSVESNGSQLFYHGNMVAKRGADGLFISNGGFVPDSGATGSATTKDLLNMIPNVSLHQSKFKWVLNGTEWNGTWTKVN